MVSIVGRNGAGKSTLSKLICGFETPDAGEIFLNGKPLAEENIRRRARHIGYVMQNPNQMISKTMIFEEVALALQGSDMTQEQICQRVEDTLKVCGLYPFRNWPISALSFGQKKRVTIASVLVQQPELIILDEPTSMLDVISQAQIVHFLQEYQKEHETAYLFYHPQQGAGEDRLRRDLRDPGRNLYEKRNVREPRGIQSVKCRLDFF